MAEHLGYDKHDPAGRNRGNSRNGKRAKTVLTDSGEVAVEVPRDRDGSFEPVIVAKRQRRLSSIDEIRLSLYARGLTTGDIAAHFAEIYDAQVSKDTISRITDRVVEEMQAWTSRPLERVYAAVVVDAINVKVRDGQVANRPFYAAIGVDLEGHKDILGMWFGHGGGKSAKFWLAVRTELRNCGVADVFFPGLRRPKRPARQCEHSLASHNRAEVSDPLDRQLVQICLQEEVTSAVVAVVRPRASSGDANQRRLWCAVSSAGS